MRLFIAAKLPPGARSELAGVMEQIKGTLPAKYRWVKPANIHLTLNFLGEVSCGEAANIEAAFGAPLSIGGPIYLKSEGIGAFPSLARAQTLWVGLGGEVSRLAALQELTTKRLLKANISVEKRGFKPHLTLARAKGRGRPPDILDQAERFVGFYGPYFKLDEVILFESDLRPGGPIYTPRVRVNIV
ncbi:MAG: RNA 2',3'-cyclic phosphodiesterase [Deltaproteobacteria bacterium]|nr:MAG: RNA 2',3'-cyclic phosphodiesterase [Deltaproteobacteria bacterium]